MSEPLLGQAAQNKFDNSQPTNPSNSSEDSGSDNFTVAPPSIALPKGGGAIRGMGEKFAANPVTGTGSMSVPIATTPGRSGFGPELSLSYDSGVGNGPFGFGWSLSVPQISRKTDKGLPRYLDSEESDVFLLSGSEDLVPVLSTDGDRWRREQLPLRNVGGLQYRIQRYRPRIEGLFARIERWTQVGKPSDSFWRTITRENVTTWYGKTEDSRIADPEDSNRIYSWLICETHDDKGYVAVYRYQDENSDGIQESSAHERNRTEDSRSSNRYLKRICYGNHAPYLPVISEDTPFPTPPIVDEDKWYFEVVFDYGDHDKESPSREPSKPWPVRPDPFSSYRSGFELRTYRVCQRVLMFHHFSDEDIGRDCLVRSTAFTYSHEDNPEHVRNPVYTFLKSVQQSGYKQIAGEYLKRSLPPIEFEYTQPVVQEKVEEVQTENLENLPVGVDGSSYQWTDLHGEGIPGILSEQADSWFYKRNLSPAVGNEVEFAPTELVASKPNIGISGGRGQFMDLAGDGLPDLVVLGGPFPGLFEHNEAESWQPYRPFRSRLNRDLRDPNLRFVDLDGDGHADLLITENDAFLWHASLEETGFDSAEKVFKEIEEENGPRVVFNDGTQSIYLADMSGDGLTDIVRLRNGEVCYWPNLGYGSFGKKITMDHSPHFDNPDQFDQSRIRLADIDGTGTIDIIYLHRDGVRLYFNQSGNSWSNPHFLRVFPRFDEIVSIATADLLGNGTACLVWSSPLPADASRPMRYVNLMGGTKPHLLVETKNNLGAETHIEYAPSTKFYLQDKLAGTPWITRLPFPVHVVEKVTVIDRWRQSRFATTYSYHHGYFDGDEREFRGFGRVDQIDVESFGQFSQGNVSSPYITDDQTLYQPPVKTVTWFHTGASRQQPNHGSQYQQEFFPNWIESPEESGFGSEATFREKAFSQPELTSDGLNSHEWRQALRAYKGAMLRQEIYELDVDALEQGQQIPVKIFSASQHDYEVRTLQPTGENRYAVFLRTECESISYHYELDLRERPLFPDPRIAHTLNLRFDQYGHPLQSVTVGYERQEAFEDDSLEERILDRIHGVQNGEENRHIAYTETRYTENDVDVPDFPDQYRVRVPCEILTYELTGIAAREIADRYFSLEDIQRYQLSEYYEADVPNEDSDETETPIDLETLTYHEITREGKRIVEHVRMLYFHQNLNDPLPLGQLNSLGIPFETYKLALTDELLEAVFAEKLTDEIRNDLEDSVISGYLSGDALDARFPATDNTGEYWIRSGIAGFAPDAPDHFYLPELYIDPFENITTLEYDQLDLFIESSTDPVENTIRVMHFDYRVLAPLEIKDINDNLSEITFDALGLPAAMALKGKGSEGDSIELDDPMVNPSGEERRRFFTGEGVDNPAEAMREIAGDLLGEATVRHFYYFGETLEDDGTILYGEHPACAASIQREQHSATAEESPLQIAFEYSDGTGKVLVNKSQAEPEDDGGTIRWLASGKTVLNNKGKPVRQYEPYFSVNEDEIPDYRFEEPREIGVTPVMYYDAVGRLIRTELPDGTFSRVEFSPWHVTSFDANDTVVEPANRWFEEHTNTTAGDEDRRAAELAEIHANTPSCTFLDSLGRDVVTVSHNRWTDNTNALHDEKYLTFTKLDAEGKPLWIRDDRDNIVMQYLVPQKQTRWIDESDEGIPSNSAPCYDIAGNLLFQHSMDAGDRWMLSDAAGQPFYAWDFNERVLTDGSHVDESRIFHTTYDSLHRPRRQKLQVDDTVWHDVEVFVYGEGQTDDKGNNLRGQVYRHYDSSGRIENVRFDFKGNLLEVQKSLASDYEPPVIDWSVPSPEALLEEESYTQVTEFDALNRMSRLYNWHRDADRVAVYEPRYNERGLLKNEDLVLRAERTVDGYSGGNRTHAIVDIHYNEKGQRSLIRYGNRTETDYQYDPLTFRLTQLRTLKLDDTLPFDERKLQLLSYTYDPVGNITEIYDDAFEPVFFRNQIVEPRTQYVYDALYRLIQASGREQYSATGAISQRSPRAPEVTFPIESSTDPNALRNYTQHFTYDSVGNIRQMRHVAGGATGSWTRNYEYADDSNRLLVTSTNNPLETVEYEYDTHGSMLNLNCTPDRYDLHWDYQDMIAHVDLEGGGQAWYNYNFSKQRTRKRIERNGSIVEERLYLGGMEVYRRWQGRTLLEEIESHHLFVDDERVLLVDDVQSTDNARLGTGLLFRYQYGSHRGSVILELDHTAAPIMYEAYHPYGTTAYQARNRDIRATTKRYRYTGMQRDEEMGLSYHSARYYAPWLDRWCSTDPIGIGSGLNIYEFTFGRPISSIDTNGMDPIPDPGRFQTFEEFRDATTAPYTEEYLYQRWTRYQEVQLQRLLNYPNTSTVAPDPGDRLGITPENTITTSDAQRLTTMRPIPEVTVGDRLPFTLRPGETLTAGTEGEIYRHTGTAPPRGPFDTVPHNPTLPRVGGTAQMGEVLTVDAEGRVWGVPEPPNPTSQNGPSGTSTRPSGSTSSSEASRSSGSMDLSSRPGSIRSGGVARLAASAESIAGGVAGVLGGLLMVKDFVDHLKGREQVELEGMSPSEFEVGHEMTINLGNGQAGTVRVEENWAGRRRFYLLSGTVSQVI